MDRKTLNRAASGLADKNIRFQDLTKLLGDFGFSVRTKGDHRTFYKKGKGLSSKAGESDNLQIQAT